MKTIFLSDKTADLQRVYSRKLVDTICAQAEADPTFYTRQMILDAPGTFTQVRYIFSTWGMPVFTEEEIAEIFPNLECLFYAAGTVQKFARPFLARGVKVFSAWMANAVPVAEYTVAQILLANKGYFSSSRLMSEVGHRPAKDNFKQFPGNYDTPVGIVGTGAIGALVCEYLKPFRLRVMACSRSLTEEKAAKLGVEKSDMETIFRTCQVVSNHLANNAHTQGIFKKEHFASMVPNGVFLNTGRGAQVNEADMIEVLQQRPDLTAVLDVTFPEPPVEGSPMYSLPNCVLTPHIAGSAGNEVQRMSEWIYQEYERYTTGKPCLYQVTEGMLESMA